MVRTRNSLPSAADAGSSSTPANTSRRQSSRMTLGDREAKRLETNAKFEEDNKNQPDLGTYHWRGSVYAITPDTKPEWIREGNAEWARIQEARTRKKSAEETTTIGPTSAASISLANTLQGKAKDKGKGKRPVDREEDIQNSSKKRKTAQAESVNSRNRAPSTAERRRGGVGCMSTSTSTKNPARRQTPPTTTASRRKTTPAPNRRDKENDSTASSNIEVSSWPRTTTTKIPTRPAASSHDDDEMYQAAEDRSTDDGIDMQPSSSRLGVANMRIADRTEQYIQSMQTKSKKKGLITSPLPERQTPKTIAVQQLTRDLSQMAKTNDRIAALRTWWDSQKSVGAFQRLVSIARDIKQGREVPDVEMDDMRELSVSIDGNESVEKLLQDIVAEEEESEREEMDRGIPTPESQDLAPPQAAVPTPPPSSSETTSPRVLVSPPKLELPQTDGAGNPLRWSLDPAKLVPQLKVGEMADPFRAEHAIHMKRLEGESVTARRRRVRRELRQVSGWTIIVDPNGGVEEEGGDEGEGSGRSGRGASRKRRSSGKGKGRA